MTSKGFTRLFRVSEINQALVRVYEIKALNHELCIAFNVDTDPAIITRYKLAFAQLQQNGTIASLMKKWQVPL